MEQLFHNWFLRKKNGDVFSALMSAFLPYWKRWLSFLGIGQVIPFFEIGFIACVYMILSPTQINAMKLRMAGIGESYPAFQPTANFIVSNPELAALLAGLSLLTIFVCLRYFLMVQSQVLRYEQESADANLIASRFIFSSPGVVQKFGKDRIISSILQDSGKPGAVIKYGLDMLIALWSIGIYITASLYSSWQISVVVIGIYAIPVWFTRRIYGRMIGVGEIRNATHEKVLAFLTDLLSSYNRIKLDALEATISDRANETLKRNFAWRISKRRLQSQMTAVMDAFSLVGLVTALYFGVVMLETELALLMTLFILFNRVKAAISTLTNSYLACVDLLPNIRRLNNLLSTIGEEKYRTTTSKLPRSNKPITRIELKKISVSFSGTKPVLKEIDLVLEAGDRILISGPSGQGKSTLAETIAGLLPPSQGQVFVNNQIFDAKIFNQLRHRISLVSPNFFLFDDTIAANLELGATEENLRTQIDESLDKARLAETCRLMPEGLNKQIGPNGRTLSLGERQRLVLAHLYIKNPDLVLLDEATANMDPELESDVIKRLETFLAPGAIILMVAHKPPKNFCYTRHYHINEGRLLEVKGNNLNNLKTPNQAIRKTEEV
jgi:ATP-binding cassette, subfamily B, bacterial MsbA